MHVELEDQQEKPQNLSEDLAWKVHCDVDLIYIFFPIQ